MGYRKILVLYACIIFFLSPLYIIKVVKKRVQKQKTDSDINIGRNVLCGKCIVSVNIRIMIRISKKLINNLMGRRNFFNRIIEYDNVET